MNGNPATSKKVILAPSILAADFGRLAVHCQEAIVAGADWLHVDVMDGHFVPNISFGAVVMAGIRPLAESTNTPLDVHLMIENPDQYLAEFAEAGAHRITVHVEATHHLHRTVQAIQDLGVKAGVTLNPATPLLMLEEILPLVDLVLVMSVNPGFGGQSYIPSSTDKIRRLRQMIEATNPDIWLEVDGGISPKNAAEIVAAGANALVAGSAIFRGEKSVAENVGDFRRAVLDRK